MLDLTTLRATAMDQAIVDWLHLHQQFGERPFTSADACALWTITQKAAGRRLRRLFNQGFIQVRPPQGYFNRYAVVVKP